jgi:hypothetical protein
MIFGLLLDTPAFNQIIWRGNRGDEHASEKSFLYGKSINNQRIESLWGIIRRQGIQFWMNFFQELIEDGRERFRFPCQLLRVLDTLRVS